MSTTTIALRTKDGRRFGAVRLRPFGTPALLLFTAGAWQRDAFPHGSITYIPPRGPASPSVSVLMIP